MRFIKPPTSKVIGKVLKRYDYEGKNLVLVFNDHDWCCFSVNDSGEIMKFNNMASSSSLDIPDNRLVSLGICQHDDRHLARLKELRKYINEQIEMAESEQY